jgi:fibro-slime domain-containing protein
VRTAAANGSAGTLGIDLGGSTATAGSSNGGTSGTGAEDTSGCGDGVLQAAALGEKCDDGNSEPGDGCSADCKVIEQNYSCLTPGMPCESTVMCGDGSVGGTETCDDGNAAAGDGCDAACQQEMGWLCPRAGEPCAAAKCGDGIIAGIEQCEDDDAVPTSGDGCSDDCALEPGFVCETAKQKCRAALCGDGKIEGGEPCDDMNTVVGDGCSPGCEAEPTCTKPSDADGCSSSCGDGILLDGDAEECDDGNKRDGDGCSATCRVEAGYRCEKQAGVLPATISISFVFRDFIAFPSMTTTLKRHPDFQARCVGQQANGMVNAALDAAGKPVNSNSCNLLAACTVNNGYIDPVNGDHCAEHESCPAGFDQCDQLHALHPLAGNAGDPFNFWYRTTAGVNKEKVVATTLTLTNGRYSFNSGALFPFDNGGWVTSGDEVQRNNHNFGFTSEVRRWFTFDGGELLTFNGDDDVWVFINGKLAMDLGGVHQVETRTIRLNPSGTVDCKIGEPGAQTFEELANCVTPQRDLDLTLGEVYEIALFHAERHSDASNFRLALTGFVSAKSKCTPQCGDGTQTPGESCDNGTMNGDVYDGCTTQCTRGPRCGDSVRQMMYEECDDGRNLTPYSPIKGDACAPGCKLPSYCGDGKLDSLFGEKCDDGTNAGGYGGCNPSCQLGPRCGDGKVDAEVESCDDGNAVSGDGCSSSCKKEMPK